MSDIQKLLKLRKAMKAKKPHFKRQDWHKKARLKPVWRKPKGMDSKLRKHMLGHGFVPTQGYGSPALVRGMHKSGLVPVLVNNVNEVSAVNGKTHGVFIASTVGTRKVVEIMTVAHAKGIRVLNFKDSTKYVAKIKEDLTKRKHEKKAHVKVEPKVEKKPEAKKETMTQEEKKEAEKRTAEKVMTQKD